MFKLSIKLEGDIRVDEFEKLVVLEDLMSVFWETAAAD
jgi:hypothetical protein